MNLTAVRPRFDIPRTARPVLMSAFGASGGVMSGDDLACMLRRFVDQPVSRVAQWIAQREVVSFVWQAEFQLPMFQFEPLHLTPRPRIGAVIAELGSTYDDLDIAEWFVRPNEWLGDATPAQLIALDAGAVLRAARADRFVVAG